MLPSRPHQKHNGSRHALPPLGASLGTAAAGLLSLSRQYELDEMALPIEQLIETFPDEVQPYAVEIARQLVRRVPAPAYVPQGNPV